MDVTEVYCRHSEEHDLDMRALTSADRDPLCSRRQRFVRSVAESKALNLQRGPMIILSASGMATGGRILHHLEARLGDERNTILLPGYQAAGTRGRARRAGAPQLKIHGAMVPVRAQVATLDGLSAHADADDLMRWARGFQSAPRHAWVVHGEPPASQALAQRLCDELQWRVDVARDGETVALDA
jgi:metallo-beta-lactamase family protein